MEDNWICGSNNSLIIAVYIVPRSSKPEIVGIYNNALKIRLKAPPVDNAANDELIKFLADKLNLPKSNIEIVRGHTQKRKIVSIVGLNIEKARNFLSH